MRAGYVDSNETLIEVTVSGATSRVPVDVGNRHYREPIDSNVVIEDFVQADPTANDVRAEAGRRITSQYPIWKQLNQLRSGDWPNWGIAG